MAIPFLSDAKFSRLHKLKFHSTGEITTTGASGTNFDISAIGSNTDLRFLADNDDGSSSVYFLLDASMADYTTPDYYTRFPDNSHLVFGNSANTSSLDFEIYHSGTTAYLQGDSSMYIASENLIQLNADSGVELRHNNSRKIHTTTTGVDVTGTINLDNLTINGAQGSDGQVLTSTGSGIAWEDASGGSLSGGTNNYVPIWTSSSTLGSSALFLSSSSPVTYSFGSDTVYAGLRVNGSTTGGDIATFRSVTSSSSDSSGIVIENQGSGSYGYHTHIKMKSKTYGSCKIEMGNQGSGYEVSANDGSMYLNLQSEGSVYIRTSGTSQLFTFYTNGGLGLPGGGILDGGTRRYCWTPIPNSASNGGYYRLVDINGLGQSDRFIIQLVGRSTSYTDGTLGAMGYIVGQANNDNNVDLVFYNHSGEDEVVDEVGLVDDGTTGCAIWVKVGNYSEVGAFGYVTNQNTTFTTTSSYSSGQPTGYSAVTEEYTVWNSKNDGANSGLDADLLDGQQGSYYLNYNNFTNTPTIPTVNNGTLTVQGTGALGGSGTFTANQSTNATISISHDDTSSQSSVNNSDGTVIQDVTLDGYGHVTALGSVDLDDRFLQKTYSQNWTRLGYGTSGSAYWHRLAQVTINGSYKDYLLKIKWTSRYNHGELAIHIHSDNDTTADVWDATMRQFGENQKKSISDFKYIQSGSNVQIWVRTPGWREFDYIRQDAVTEGTPTINWYKEGDSGASKQTSDPGGTVFTNHTPWSPMNDGSGTGLDADLLDGLQTTSSGDRWGVVPTVGSTGVLEVGKYIDFHESDTTTSDYNYRITSTSGRLYFSGDIEVDGGDIYINDGNTRLTEGSNNALRMQTNSGYVDIGAQNSSYSHFSTDRPVFYFNKGLTVDSGIVRSYDENLELNRAGSSTARLRITSSATISDQNFDVGSYHSLDNNGQFILGDPGGIQSGISLRCDTSDITVETSAGLTLATFGNSGNVFGGSVKSPIYYDSSGTTYYLDLGNTGDSLRTAGDIVAYYSSDKRYKENIKPIESPIEKVKAISGVTFEWNEKSHKETGKKDIGVIAQEVEEVLPEIVQTRDNGYKAVDYQKLTAVLIEAIKDQQKQIDELKSIINGGS